MERIFRLSLIGTLFVAGILVVLLTLASGAKVQWLQNNHSALIRFSYVVSAVLFFFVVFLLKQLVVRYKKGLFGTRLMARLSLSFCLMTILPVFLVYFVSVQFVTRSIQSWFDSPVERGIQAGLDLGRSTLDEKLSQLLEKARSISSSVSGLPSSDWSLYFNRMREQFGRQDILLMNASGQIFAQSGGSFPNLVTDPLPINALQQARLSGQYAAIEGLEIAGATGFLLRGIVRVDPENLPYSEPLYVQLTEQTPDDFSGSARMIEEGYREFQQQLVWRNGLKQLFEVSLTLTLLLTVFSALGASFLLSDWLTGPLFMLAAGTRAVAKGDFRPMLGYSGRDELGLLTEEFNAMTRQLDDARALVERNQNDLTQANARLESILSNLTAGVLVLNSRFILTLANSGAEKILSLKLCDYYGKSLTEIPRISRIAEELVSAFQEQTNESLCWQKQFFLSPEGEQDLMQQNETSGSFSFKNPMASNEQIILAKGSFLSENEAEHIVVFDDITQLVSGQRVSAWAEVACRVAHEIKNPLTPIQLAAERMHKKLMPKLSNEEALLLEKSTKTIVSQVTALKFMVDEFRDYARLPRAEFFYIELNGLVEDVLGLYFSGCCRIRSKLSKNLPKIYADQNQLRQLIHNLLNNAIDATDSMSDSFVEVETVLVNLRNGSSVPRLSVRDNGGGISTTVLPRIFEPYVTTKKHGSGLGLAIVRKIIDEHGAIIDISNWSTDEKEIEPNQKGALITVVFPKIEASSESSNFDSLIAKNSTPSSESSRTTEQDNSAGTC